MTRTICLQSIYELAKQDERVVFIGSDLSPNTMLNFKRDFPNRFFMEGVQEQNIVGLAAGLALEGFIPYINTISTFLTRRCYEQVVLDVCLHNLPVRLIGNGGGLVYAPLGATHCAIDDIAIMRAIPNMSIVCCSDNEEMKAFMPTTLEHKGPMYIRLGKDSDPIIDHAYCGGKDKESFEISICDLVHNTTNGSNILILSTGIMTHKAIQIANNIGYIDVLNIATIKPFESDGIRDWIIDNRYDCIVTMEEGIINGGLGSAVLECLADNNIQIPVLRFGLPDAFPCHYGEQEDLLETYGLTPEKMAKRIKEFYDTL